MTEETVKKANTHGGAREGAGRKKSLPDGRLFYYIILLLPRRRQALLKVT